MDDKRNSLLTIGLVCAVLLVLGVADLWNSDRVYSEAENRALPFPGRVFLRENTGMRMRNTCPTSS